MSQSGTEAGEAQDHDLDECECGDYRRDHVNRTGACKFNSPHFDVCHADVDCTAFRLFCRAGEREARELAASVQP